MKQLMLDTTDGVQTMSSLAMVEYINATRAPGEAELLHKNFLAKVLKVLGLGTSAKFSAHVQVAGPNGATRQSPVYNFPRREAMLMAMSYSYDLQASVFDAWQAAEAALTKPALPSFPEALRMLADSVEREAKQTLQIATQAVQIEAAAPAVAFVDKYVESSGLKTFRQVAKLLMAPEREFRNFLSDRRIMYQLNGAWIHMQAHAIAGRFASKTGVTAPVEGHPDGKSYERSYFTSKGVEWVAKLWNERTPMLRKALTVPTRGFGA